jgi:hypothetical protein
MSALGKTSVTVHQWTAKQFWVDSQSFKHEDNIYRLETVQINKLSVYLQFMLIAMSVIHTNHTCVSSILLNRIDVNFLVITYYCYIYISFVVILIYDK